MKKKHQAKFILSRKKVLEQYEKLKELGVKVSYSFKTNRDVGKVLEQVSDCDFSVHLIEEIDMLRNKDKIWFFPQAWNIEEVKEILRKGVRIFVIDNEKDLEILLEVISELKIKINLSLRMKFKENRIGTGKYFVYGMSANKVNKTISEIKNNKFIDRIGINVHRKSQNVSEWDITNELKDSLTEESLKRISFFNLGGGLPVKYKTYVSEVLPYIFDKIKQVAEWLREKGIDCYIEPGRFIAGPSVKLETEIIQIYDKIIVINTSLYNCALDTHITGIKLLIENEFDEDSEKGEYYLVKGNSPTRDDIFRYKVKLKNPKVGDKIVFLNAGAYNYTTDFCSFKKLDVIEE